MPEDLKVFPLLDCFGVKPSQTPNSLLPQPIANGQRFDELFGLNAALIGRDLPNEEFDGVVSIDLDSAKAAPFSAAMSEFLESVNEEAVLVRPDKHIFGTGPSEALPSAWQQKLS